MMQNREHECAPGAIMFTAAEEQPYSAPPWWDRMDDALLAIICAATLIAV